MTVKTHSDRPRATVRAAEIVREYGPFEGVQRMAAIYPSGSAAGSNKIVVNPVSGGASQRRARVWPTARTRPASSSWASERCTVRWLAPSAIAKAEVVHAVPSANKATSSP